MKYKKSILTIILNLFHEYEKCPKCKKYSLYSSDRYSYVGNLSYNCLECGAKFYSFRYKENNNILRLDEKKD